MNNGSQIVSASISDRGLSLKRPQNEDSFLEIAASGIFAVADGVGGAQAGEVASQMAVEILGEAFTNMKAGADAEHVMHLALVQANSAIHQMSTDLPQLAQMATTVVALHLADNIATIGHAGDSRLYRLDADGQLHRETDDHSMVAEEVRSGRMTEEQAENHPSKNIISRALGAEPTVKVDLKTMMVSEDSTFLLCSDGVTRHIGDGELRQLLAAGSEPSAICSQIKDICYERGAEDNLTAVIVKMSVDQAVDFDETIPQLGQDVEETTVAAARPPYVSGQYDPNDDDDDILELDTAELTKPSTLPHFAEADIFTVHEQPVRSVSSAEMETVETRADETHTDVGEIKPTPLVEEFEAEPIVSYEPTETVESSIALIDEPAVEPVENTDIYTQPEPIDVGEHISQPNGKGFSDVDHPAAHTHEHEKPSVLSNIASALFTLIIGTMLGLGAYHFLIAPTQQLGMPQLGEMKSGNIALTAFEESRRNVDRDPEAYLRLIPQPQNASDYYLVGRAYILTGDFIKARTAFVESQKLLFSADRDLATDPKDAKVIANDIAMAMAVTNDPLTQANLRKDLDTAKSPPNMNTATNTNR